MVKIIHKEVIPRRTGRKNRHNAWMQEIRVSVSFFLFLTALLLLLSGVRMRNYNITFVQVEE